MSSFELAAVQVNHGYCACTWRGVRPDSQGSHAEQGTIGAFAIRDTASALAAECGPHLPQGCSRTTPAATEPQATRWHWNGRRLDGPCDVHV